MSINDTSISFYVDTLIVEALLSNDLYKQASAEEEISKYIPTMTNVMSGGNEFGSSIVGSIKDYIHQHFDQNNKTESIINILAPGVIWTFFKALNLGWLGIIFGLLEQIFHWNIGEIVMSICSDLTSYLKGGNKISSDQIKDVVNNNIEKITKNTVKSGSNKFQDLRMAKLFKLTAIDYEKNQNIEKFAGIGALFGLSFLSTILSWIFKVLLASAFFTVAGDAVNHLVGRPNAFDGTLQTNLSTDNQGSTSDQSSHPVHVSTQTKFKQQPSYQDEIYNQSVNWVENIPNNSSSIEDMLVSFAKQVYQGLDGLELLIKSDHIFQLVVRAIFSLNARNPEEQKVYIPRAFTSKKQIVDLFIDDVAAKAPDATDATKKV